MCYLLNFIHNKTDDYNFYWHLLADKILNSGVL